MASSGRVWSGKNPYHAYNEKYEKQLRALENWGQEGPGKQLPPLSKETAAQWATATGPFFRIVYGDNFEEHPNLKKLKRSVSLGARDAFGKDNGPGVIRA